LKGQTPFFFFFWSLAINTYVMIVTLDTSTCTAHHRHEMRYRKSSPAMLSSYDWTLVTIVGFPLTKSKSQYPGLAKNAI